MSRSQTRGSAPARGLRLGALVATATLAVAGLPVAVVCWLRATGTVSSLYACVALGMAVSLFVSWAGRALWEKRADSLDLLFNELLVWGYVHRWYTERRVARALELLGAHGAHAAAGARDGGAQTKLLQGLVAEIEARDPYLHGHSRRVARHSWMIARRMGLGREQAARIRTAAAIHDIGKMGTPKEILHKPGPLDDAEYEVIKRHPGAGARMAAVLGDPELTAMVRHHHERLSGTGYPSGLAGEEIPLGARIIAVADTFDAITSERPYRAASPHRKALDVLKADAGVRLDPAVVRAFCGHYAGWRPLALWGLAAALPEWLAASLGGGVAGLAAAARVPVLAALLGGVAATSSPLAVHPVHHHAAARRAPSHALLLSRAAPASAPSASSSAPAARHGRHATPNRHTAPPPSPSQGAPNHVGPRAPSQAPAAGPRQTPTGAGAGGSAGGGEGRAGPGGGGAGAGVGETVEEAGGTVGEAKNTTKVEEVVGQVQETAASATGASQQLVHGTIGEVERTPARVQATLGALP